MFEKIIRAMLRDPLGRLILSSKSVQKAIIWGVRFCADFIVEFRLQRSKWLGSARAYVAVDVSYDNCDIAGKKVLISNTELRSNRYLTWADADEINDSNKFRNVKFSPLLNEEKDIATTVVFSKGYPNESKLINDNLILTPIDPEKKFNIDVFDGNDPDYGDRMVDAILDLKERLDGHFGDDLRKALAVLKQVS